MTDEGRRLLEAASPRPWRFPVGGAIVSIPGRDNVSFGEVKHADAALIVAAVNSYEALLDVADAAAAVLLFVDPITGDEIADRDRLRWALAALTTSCDIGPPPAENAPGATEPR